MAPAAKMTCKARASTAQKAPARIASNRLARPGRREHRPEGDAGHEEIVGLRQVEEFEAQAVQEQARPDPAHPGEQAGEEGSPDQSRKATQTSRPKGIDGEETRDPSERRKGFQPAIDSRR